MSNITSYPLEDNFETELSQQWTGGTGTMYVVSTPSFTFPSGITTYVIVNPGKSNMQLAEIDSYNSSNKTLNVSNVTLNKGASVAYSAQTHSVGSKVVISDNYQFWADMATAINTKVNTETGQIDSYADATARDAAITSPVNGMQVYLTTEGTFTDYVAGSWQDRASGTNPNASTTVAGRVEIATDAEVTAGTGTGGTGAILSVTPTQVNKLVSLATTDTTSDETDYYIFQDAAASDVNKKITQANLRTTLAASTTVKGMVEMATDAEATAGTDEERYINPKQAADNYTTKANTVTTTLTFDDGAQSNINIAHGLSKVPRVIIGRFDVETTADADDFAAGMASYDGSTITQKCFIHDITPNYENTMFSYSDGTTDYGRWSISSIDSTNITLSYSYNGSFVLVTRDFSIQFIS